MVVLSLASWNVGATDVLIFICFFSNFSGLFIYYFCALLLVDASIEEIDGV